MQARNPSVNTPLINTQTGIINNEWLRYLISLSTSGPNLAQRNSAPAGPSEGDSYYDLVLHKARTWNGSTWKDWW